MVAKTEKSQAMIEKILSTATQLFIHNGYEKTSVQNIAQTASISKGAIYHHFQSKDDIFFAVLKQRYQLMEKELLDWLESTSHLSGREQLKEIFQFSLKSQKTNYEMLNHAPLDAEFILTIIRYNLRIGTPLIADIIKKGIEDQSIQHIPFPNEAAETILLLTNFWVEGSIFENSSEKIVDRSYFLQFMLQSIGLDIFDESLIQEILSQSN
ncbi:MAG: TetR/AcrR family transcriptional regulator [Streptococcus mitis]|nr:TetR/AcrR family transcriptional regulator [Streptococcus mitis]